MHGFSLKMMDWDVSEREFSFSRTFQKIRFSRVLFFGT